VLFRSQNQSSFQPVTGTPGNLGTLSLASNGSYTYSVANSAVQYLGASDSKVDTFTVTSFDGTSKQVSFTIHGTNDAAQIGAPTVADVTEDATTPNLVATGSISISDPDVGQSSFKTTVSGVNSPLGTLALAANGAYTYTVANSAVQYLGANDSKVDTFTVTSFDGTTKQVSFTIHGTNDAAVITGTTTGAAQEDTTLSASGALTVTDVDAGQSTFQAQTATAAPTAASRLIRPESGPTRSTTVRPTCRD
jgi:VCBS repeat-containing protein